jgi:hypothetical protein
MNTTTLNMTTLDGGNVIIKRGEGGGSTPTPPSGESSSIEYLDVSIFPAEIVGSLFVPYSISARGMSNPDRVFVMPSAIAIGAIDNITIEAVAVDFSLQVIEMGTISTIKDAFIAQGVTQSDFDSIPRITKEQFYSLD